MKLERRAGWAGSTPQGPRSPAEGFPLSSEYTSIQKGGDVLLFKQQNKISCENPTCNAGERRTSVGQGVHGPGGTQGTGLKRHGSARAFACLNQKGPQGTHLHLKFIARMFMGSNSKDSAIKVL